MFIGCNCLFICNLKFDSHKLDENYKIKQIQMLTNEIINILVSPLVFTKLCREDRGAGCHSFCLAI